MSSPAPLDPERLFTTLARHRVAYAVASGAEPFLVVGAIAGG